MDPLQRARRELERNAVRARNGIKYLSGASWSTLGGTPKDIVWRQGKVELWRYRSENVSQVPPVLLFIGLVSRSSIFDLHERASFVRALRDAGFDVFLLDWGVPDAGDADNTLETYVCRYLTRAVEAMRRLTKVKDASLIGYCMGGNLALLAAASGLPVRNLVCLATAVDFNGLPSFFRDLLDSEEGVEGFIDPESGLVPANVIESAFRVRKPTATLVQHANLLENLWNDAYVQGHQAIARWTGDHVPLPGALARQAVRSWLGQNAFLEGKLVLNGEPVDLASVDCPVLGVLTKRDEIVPPDAARPLPECIGSDDSEMLEIDAGHIGLMVGRSAHKVAFPKIIDWLGQRSVSRADA